MRILLLALMLPGCASMNYGAHNNPNGVEDWKLRPGFVKATQKEVDDDFATCTRDYGVNYGKRWEEKKACLFLKGYLYGLKYE